MRLYDVESGSILKTFTGEHVLIPELSQRIDAGVSGHSLSISSVMFNPLGNLIVSGSVHHLHSVTFRVLDAEGLSFVQIQRF